MPISRCSCSWPEQKEPKSLLAKWKVHIQIPYHQKCVSPSLIFQQRQMKTDSWELFPKSRQERVCEGRGKKTCERKKKEKNNKKGRGASVIWINYILKNFSFAFVSAQNLNKCQLPLCLDIFSFFLLIIV